MLGGNVGAGVGAFDLQVLSKSSQQEPRSRHSSMHSHGSLGSPAEPHPMILHVSRAGGGVSTQRMSKLPSIGSHVSPEQHSAVRSPWEPHRAFLATQE